MKPETFLERWMVGRGPQGAGRPFYIRGAEHGLRKMQPRTDLEEDDGGSEYRLGYETMRLWLSIRPKDHMENMREGELAERWL